MTRTPAPDARELDWPELAFPNRADPFKDVTFVHLKNSGEVRIDLNMGAVHVQVLSKAQVASLIQWLAKTQEPAQ